MREIWDDFEKAVNGMMHSVNGKQVALWGYGYSGWFIEHILGVHGRKVDYRFDVDISNKIACDPPTMLYELNWETCFLIITIDASEEVTARIGRLGIKEGKNYLFAKKIFGMGRNGRLNYYTWLESRLDLDISGVKGLDILEKTNENAREYSSNIEYGVVDVLREFYIDPTDAFFDFGCGKGGALILADYMGFSKIGGVEFDRELHNIAVKNLQSIGMDTTEILCGDAQLINEKLDSYNYFYFYNPFVGETLLNVIHNIEKSFERKNRKITLIYRNPRCSVLLKDNSRFVLTRRIYNDSWIRHVYVYILEP